MRQRLRNDATATDSYRAYSNGRTDFHTGRRPYANAHGYADAHSHGNDPSGRRVQD